MPSDNAGVQWAGQTAVVKLPQHVDNSNADQVREQLLWVINRGAIMLIADMTATLSCDYSGADAVARAYRRAVASGIELRLAVTAGIVRRTLHLNGLHRLVSMYPTVQAALAAGPERDEPRAGTAASTPAAPGVARLLPVAADPADRTGELLDSVVEDIFAVALGLQEATDLPRDVIAGHITEALGGLDGIVGRIRDHRFAQQTQVHQPGMVTAQPPGPGEQPAETAGRAAALRQRLAQTARTMHATATETAALLTQRASLAKEPHRIDYRTEAKRWRALADQAQQIAERWEESPPAS